MKTIRIIGRVDGQPTEYDGKYVVWYDPTVDPPGEEYVGGVLQVTPNEWEAQKFEDYTEAAKTYLKTYGDRPDGKPNRPLLVLIVWMVVTWRLMEALQ